MHDLTPDRYLELLAHEVELTSALIERGPLDTQVPTCPDWDVAGLVRHTGGIHRWVTSLIGAAGEAVPFPKESPDNAGLAAWFAEGAAALQDALATAPLDQPAMTFIGPKTTAFWVRRMAHETAVHRWDGENAVGPTAPIDALLSADGISEIFEVYLVRAGEGFFADTDERTFHIHCTDVDGEWMIHRNADGCTVTYEHGKGTTAARGRAEDLLLFLWGRIDASTLEVFGDESQLAEWQSLFGN